MIVPSIDIMNGVAVQLVAGRRLYTPAGHSIAIAERWSVAGELAVIDLDAAMGRAVAFGPKRDLCRGATATIADREFATGKIRGYIEEAETALENVQFVIVDLPNNLLGLTVGDAIQIDVEDVVGISHQIQELSAVVEEEL